MQLSGRRNAELLRRQGSGLERPTPSSTNSSGSAAERRRHHRRAGASLRRDGAPRICVKSPRRFSSTNRRSSAPHRSRRVAQPLPCPMACTKSTAKRPGVVGSTAMRAPAPHGHCSGGSSLTGARACVRSSSRKSVKAGFSAAAGTVTRARWPKPSTAIASSSTSPFNSTVRSGRVAEPNRETSTPVKQDCATISPPGKRAMAGALGRRGHWHAGNSSWRPAPITTILSRKARKDVRSGALKRTTLVFCGRRKRVSSCSRR